MSVTHSFGDVTWYATKRRKGKINSPTFCVWTNKPHGLTAKAARMQVKQNYLHSIIYNWLDREGNVGHCSSPNEIEMRKKEAKWLARTFSTEN